MVADKDSKDFKDGYWDAYNDREPDSSRSEQYKIGYMVAWENIHRADDFAKQETAMTEGL